MDALGFIGLGQMGGPLAAHLARAGFDLTVHDTADVATPVGAVRAASTGEAAAAAEAVFLSLPDGPACIEVAAEIAATAARTKTVVELSTIGPDAAREAAAICKAAGVEYVDAPVSGGRAGALAGTVTVMWAGPAGELDRRRDALATFSANVFHVGDDPGQGQALKILNNFLSGTAMAATSEAILYGLTQGLDMKTMLDVINASSGVNSASRDKFPDRVLTGTFDAGFKTALLAKDIGLYVENVRAVGSADALGAAVAGIWADCDRALPGSDFTRVFEFILDSGGPVRRQEQETWQRK